MEKILFMRTNCHDNEYICDCVKNNDYSLFKRMHINKNVHLNKRVFSIFEICITVRSFTRFGRPVLENSE